MTGSAYWARGANGKWKNAGNWGLATYDDDNIFHVTLAGNYTITMDKAVSPYAIDFDAVGVTLLQKSTGSIVNSRSLVVSDGTVILNASNTFYSVYLTGGLLELGKTGALGRAGITLSGGALLGIANVTVAPKNTVAGEEADGNLMLAGSVTIAAKAGTTLNVQPLHGWELNATGGAIIRFGTSKATGTVLWHTPEVSDVHISSAGRYAVHIDGGTLKAADGGIGKIFEFATATTIARGAKLDLNGHDMAQLDSAGTIVPNSGGHYINWLLGGGTITSKTAAKLVVHGGGLDGSISGKVSLHLVYAGSASSLNLTAKSTYTGGTYIADGETLILSGKGAISGAVHLLGGAASLWIDNHSGGLDISLSGAGVLRKLGDATTTLNKASPGFSGSVVIHDGILALNDARALGSAQSITLGPTVTGAATAQLLALKSLALNGAIATSAPTVPPVTGSAATLAAATGKTLTINASSWTVNDTLKIGSAHHAGTVVWNSLANGSVDHLILEIVAGKFKAGSDTLSQLTTFHTNGAQTRIDAGATLDLNGHNAMISSLSGAGKIMSTIAADLSIQAGTFSGAIAGPFTLHAIGNLTLSGVISGAQKVYTNGAVTFTGANTYAGETDVTQTLNLGAGGTTGTIASTAITLNGGATLKLNHSNDFSINAAFSGSGTIDKLGAGVAKLTHASTSAYTGNITIDEGTLALGDAAALGHASHVVFNGFALADPAKPPTLRADVDVQLTTPLIVNGSGRFAATTGHTLTLTTTSFSWQDPSSSIDDVLTFGLAGQAGTVVWGAVRQNIGQQVTNGTINVAGGTLKGDVHLVTLLNNAGQIKAAAGATLDLNGQAIASMATMVDLQGTLTNSSATDVLAYFLGSVSLANVSGHLSLSIGSNATITGLANHSGSTNAGSLLHIASTGTLTVNANVGASSVQIDGLLLKSDSSATHDIVGATTNTGLIDVRQGVLHFVTSLDNSAGFIRGVYDSVTRTVAANAIGHDDYFGGDGNGTLVLKVLPHLVDGGLGTDTVVFAKSMTLKAGTLTGIEAETVNNGATVNFSATSLALQLTMATTKGHSATVIGSKVGDVLIGGLGKDTFTGKGGDDSFVFRSLPPAGNVDSIKDFAHGHDQLLLDNAVFIGLTGDWAHEFLAVSSGHKAKTAAQHLIYDKSTGALWYDSDGKGNHAAVEFAVLTTHPTLTALDLGLLA